MSHSSKSYISSELFEFLGELKRHNRREWFQSNKERYERKVRVPLQHFVMDFQQPLREISSHFRADPRPVGGSLFRIYRDVRFSPDKSPYKTHAGIQFRHEQGRDVHTPGFYLHLEPGTVFAAAGIWHPDSSALRKIRGAIETAPKDWLKAKSDPGFGELYELSGDSLKRAPQGTDPNHPQADDLRRKDFIALVSLSEMDVCDPGFLDRYARLSVRAVPFIRFLTKALDLP